MNTLSDKAILSTKECHIYCGSEITFEELEAIYGHRLLKPIRTLPNHSRNWAKNLVQEVVNLAQSEGVLNDRPKVEEALKKLRRERRIRSQAASP